MPKSSRAMEMPSSRRRRRASIVALPVWRTVSVSSSSRALAGRPAISRSRAMWLTKSLSKNWGGDTLMATRASRHPAARQAAAVVVAERKTQPVSSWMRPLFSAMWMNSVAVAIRPPGLRQRSSASSAVTSQPAEGHFAAGT